MAFKNFFGVALPVSSHAENNFTWTTPGESLLGTGGDDKFTGGGGNPMTGLAGDDTYEIKAPGDLITEDFGAGIDTAKVSKLLEYKLPDNVENLVLAGHATGLGNGLNNLITGQSNSQVLDGLGGDDILIGGTGADVFQFSAGSGYDLIADFKSVDGDKIRLNNTAFLTWTDVHAAMTQDGADVILRFDANDAVRIQNTTVDSFTADDFQYRIDTSYLTRTFTEDFDSYPSLYNASTGTGVWDTYFHTGFSSGPQSNLSHTNNDELQIYVDPGYAGSGSTPLGIDPFSVADGVLTITAQATPPDAVGALFNHNYTSGLLTTADTFYQQYGYFEMRAAMPNSQGAWPSFWLLPEDQTYGLELDVTEQIGHDTVYQTSHYYVDGVRHKTNFANQVFDATQFHTYGMLWTARELAWFVDGVEVASQPTPSDLNKPMYIIADLALGGKWPGPLPAGFTSAELKIDYIHAYAAPPDAMVASINSSQSNVGIDVNGTPGNDVLVGTVGDDTVKGFDGNDVLSGLENADTLDGGAGNDTATYAAAPEGVNVNLDVAGFQYTGGAGVDSLISIENLIGTGFADQLSGNALANSLTGDAGNDLLDGGAGNDVLSGGDGNDTATYARAKGAAVVDLMLTGPQNTGRDGTDILSSIENLIGSGFGDTLWGDDGVNRLVGGDGADKLYGRDGNDVLIGGAKGDTLTGGLGADIFRYTLVSESKGSTYDTITDFNRDEGDVIDLSTIDSNQKKSGNQTFNFLGTDKYSFHPSELRYVVEATGIHVYGDINGDTGSDFHLFIQGATTLLATDFIL